MHLGRKIAFLELITFLLVGFFITKAVLNPFATMYPLVVHDMSNDVYINWMDCTMLKNKANARFQDPPFFGSFFLLWRCFWLLITILHRSLILAIHSIANYNFSTTAHARIFQNGGKSAQFFEIRCHYSSPSRLYIHCCVQ